MDRRVVFGGLRAVLYHFLDQIEVLLHGLDILRAWLSYVQFIALRVGYGVFGGGVHVGFLFFLLVRVVLSWLLVLDTLKVAL